MISDDSFFNTPLGETELKARMVGLLNREGICSIGELFEAAEVNRLDRMRGVGPRLRD